MTSNKVKWLEIAADYRCNNACLGCFSVADDGPSMDLREVVANLQLGRRAGADALWLGGGDPTMRPDLFKIVLAARKLGYVRVKLETNAMMLAYPQYVEKAVRAGVTEVNVSIKGATAETHDRLARTDGCHRLLLQAMDNLAAASIPMHADVLVYRSNADELPDIVDTYAARGVTVFNLWLLSAGASGGEDVAAEVPRLTDLGPSLLRAARRADERGATLRSFHTPPCTMPESIRDRYFDTARFGLLVTNPGGAPFALEESPIEGGAYLESCGACAARGACRGPRADYLEIHGADEFTPIPS